MIVYRPVGMIELRLIYEAGMRAFPLRLPEQPIFYPVLNFEYAAQIARDWNATSDTFAGYVTRFELDDAYAAPFWTQYGFNSRQITNVVRGRGLSEIWRVRAWPVVAPDLIPRADRDGHMGDGVG